MDIGKIVERGYRVAPEDIARLEQEMRMAKPKPHGSDDEDGEDSSDDELEDEEMA